MAFTMSQEFPTASLDITEDFHILHSAYVKKDIILLTLGWLWGRPQALLQRRNVSSVRVGLANGTKRTPSQNWGNLLSELHVPHRQCLLLMPFCFFTSIWPSFPRFYCTPNKACLLCATPAGTYECSLFAFRNFPLVVGPEYPLSMQELLQTLFHPICHISS